MSVHHPFSCLESILDVARYVRVEMKYGSIALFACIVALGGCVSTIVNDTGEAQPAIVSVVDSSQQNYQVQPIVLTVDGRSVPKAGVAIPVDGSGSSFRDYEAGTVIATPALRPAGWDFAVAPGQRKIGLIFAIPGNGLLNWIVNTRAKGSDATGITLPLVGGCQYEIVVNLTTLGGRDFEPIVRQVRPIPTQMGLPAATSCPRASSVPIGLIKD
jgi:hypothetical protein